MAIKIRGNPEKPKPKKSPVKRMDLIEKISRQKRVIPKEPKISKAKPMVSIRMDAQTLEFFKGTGPLWQTRINDVLRNYVQAQMKAVE